MISEAILHIGLHHTGTTSFQRFLNVNRDELRRQGLLVYQPLNNGTNSVELRGAATLKHGEDHYESVKRNILAHCNTDGSEKLIASAESLWSIDLTEVYRLQSLFPDKLKRFKILFVLRDELEWAQRHWRNLDSSEFNTEELRSDWDHSIAVYREVFGDVTTLDYQETGMVERLAELCGIDVAGLNAHYSFHKTTNFKRFITKRAPWILKYYSRYLANSFLGKMKRKLMNE